MKPDVFAEFFRLRMISHGAAHDMDFHFATKSLEALQQGRGSGPEVGKRCGFVEAVIDDDQGDFERVGHWVWKMRERTLNIERPTLRFEGERKKS
jgi:hypothetical protein